MDKEIESGSGEPEDAFVSELIETARGVVGLCVMGVGMSRTNMM